MKNNGIIILVVLISFGILANNIKAAEEEPQISWCLDSSVVSKYMWRGYDLYDDHGAWQPSIDMDLFDSGFGVNVWGSFALSSGFELAEELDYTLYYCFSLFEEEQYAVDFYFNYIYFDYIHTSSDADVYESGGEVSLPNLLKIGDLAIVPSYYVGHDSMAQSGTGINSGWFHILGLSWDMPLKCPVREVEQLFSFNTEVVFNDGAYEADHDWSHAVAGLSTTFEISNWSITPSVYYQLSMDDSVNDEDELWAGISFSCSF
ncbi:MAG: hypothetical protein JEZ07_03720 [Phycisphaerae bacterium]|nr:hypothetical protein [Phycisphaerae bacterium]